MLDEDYDQVQRFCGIGACRRTGLSRCIDGNEDSDCTPGQPVGSDATCDGIDADCDTRVDEGYPSIVTTCGLGICQRNGQQKCEDGAVINTCEEGTSTAADNQCDQLDNDCDGLVDEGYVSTQTSCGVGVCSNQGNLVCTPLGLVDTCNEQGHLISILVVMG